MLELIKTRKNYIIALALMFVFISLSDTTYSLFFNADSTSQFDYSTGLLDLELVEGEQIQMANALPIIDSVGASSQAYKLTIKNVGTLPYLFDLNMVSSEIDNVIDNKYIKFQVNEGTIDTLYKTNNIISANNILFPGKELTFYIKIWLDINTPNVELGKSFNAKVTTNGTALYKTLDNSGANYPELYAEMIPVYYDGTNWKKADKSNTNEANKWYDYDDKKWANVVTIRDSEKQVFDIMNNKNIVVSSLRTNNGNLVTDENYFDLNIKNYNYSQMSNIFRIKFNDIGDKKVYIISNGKFEYYYDTELTQFVFKSANSEIYSESYSLEKGKWYILGYTYNNGIINFYIAGDKIGSSRINDYIVSNETFKIATDNEKLVISNLEVGDIYFYKKVLSDKEIANSYKNSLSIIYDNLVYGYNNFRPQTIKEYYDNSANGTIISNSDIIASYVWIPRFKYKLWNVMGGENYSSYDISSNGIEIEFEQNNISSGVIYCKDSNCYSDVNKTVVVNENDNNKYFTHPAFDDNEKHLSGFWISRNDYNLNDNISQINNIEWGAWSYLTYSKYGICQDNKCDTSLKTNNYGISLNNNDIYSVQNYNTDSLSSVVLGDATKEFGKDLVFTDSFKYLNRSDLFDYEISDTPSNKTKSVIR